MNETFNLVDRPWIPCVTPAGAVTHCGIFELLSRANEYKEIRDPSPLVTISLHRLLVAVLHRVLKGPESPEVWAQLWQNGSGYFDTAALNTYLKSPEISPRFDLFDERHPFYQTPSLPLDEIDKKTGHPKFVKPIWQMAHELAYSDNMSLFSHFTEGNWEIRTADEAARWLVAFHGFALGGLITTEEGRKKQDGSADAGQLVKSAVALAKGNNLFQTLMLNLVHYSADDDSPFSFKAAADKPAWERDNETKQDDRLFDGYLDLLTWQSRRVKLVPERDQEGNLLGVSGVVAMKGFQLPGFVRYQRETMVGFVKYENAKGSQDPWPPLGFRNGKDLWRDCHALFQSVAQKTERPLTLQWINDLRQAGTLNQKQVRLELAGLCSNQAKIYFWRHESLPLPLAYLNDASLLESLRTTIDLAERVEGALFEAVRIAAATSLKPGKDERKLAKKEREAVDRLVKSFGPERLYWSRLEEPFRALMQRLADVGGPERHGQIKQWYSETLCREALHAYRRTAGEMEHSSRALRASVRGEECFYRNLASIEKKYPFLSESNEKEAKNAGSGP
jgi:CRISPR system Cascade subunit CasA